MLTSNFTAELHCQCGQVGAANTDEFHNPTFAEDQDGWLCTRNTRPNRYGFEPLLFNFHFLEYKEQRYYYHINCANSLDFKWARVEQNRNGWLGLYGTHVIGRIIDAVNPVNLFTSQNRWKIEPLETWDTSAEGITFHLRDEAGHRVTLVEEQRYYKGEKRAFYFLHAGAREGEILKFHLRNIQPA